MKTIGNSIDIFGDSFSCPCCKFNSKFNASDTWLELLEKKYKFIIKNKSLHGTGAQWCVEEFMGLTEYSDFLLFCLPDMNRLSLDYLKNDEFSGASMLYSIMDRRSLDFPESISKKLKNKSSRIFYDYESFYTTGLNRILEVLYASFIFTKYNKYKKILIWPSSGTGYPFQNYNHTMEIPDNVYIVPRCLNLISHYEKKNVRNDSQIFFGKDNRSNHLSGSNHTILANQVSNYFINDINPDPSEFLQNFL